LDLIQRANQRNIFIALTLGLLTIAVLIYVQFKQKKKSNVLLTEKNGVIERALTERETLLREIHHRVKNNLQIISSLLNLQSKSMEDKTAQGAVTESRNRVKSMSMIHEQLYQEDLLTGVSMSGYIRQLAESLAHSYGVDSEMIQWQFDCEPIILDVDTAIPVGLILNELLTNSLKYAFAEGQRGEILVSLKMENQNLLLTVADTGKGIEAQRDKTKNSFGLNLVNSLAKKLRAEVHILAKNGTRVELVITDFKVAKRNAVV
jgi:two-component system, sensor histidine kinase PdtaS